MRLYLVAEEEERRADGAAACAAPARRRTVARCGGGRRRSYTRSPPPSCPSAGRTDPPTPSAWRASRRRRWRRPAAPPTSCGCRSPSCCTSSTRPRWGAPAAASRASTAGRRRRRSHAGATPGSASCAASCATGRASSCSPGTPTTRSVPPSGLDAEVVVVGSGPGGAITAALLAEAGRDVVVLEEGPAPIAACPPYSLRELAEKYRGGGGLAAIGRVPVAYAEARCVGGGSEINSGLHHRPPDEVLDAWRRRFAIEDFDATALAPHLAACERDVGVHARPHAAPPASQKLLDGAARLGLAALDVPRYADYAAGGDGRRLGMTTSYLPRLAAAGGRLVADTRVRRLRRTGGDWELLAEQPGGRVTLRARTVFVAAGAVQTPALLRRSGVTRNVGDTLALHPMVRVLARFPDAVNPPDAGIATAQVKALAPRLSLGCSVSTRPFLALALAEHRRRLDDVDADASRMALYYAMSTGGRGSVRVLPGLRDPLVRYRLERDDLATLADGLRVLCRTLLAAGATEVYPGVLGLGPLRSEADVPPVLPPDRTSVVALHLFASCPMGEDRRRSAVDSFGRVHDRPGLHVADASLLGGPPSVNPQGTVMGIVRRNALAFLAR
ncbi:MAG: GMC family oxidoreductase [bacterium]|nr:GMC family oxidoreductase [bacterium]